MGELFGGPTPSGGCAATSLAEGGSQKDPWLKAHLLKSQRLKANLLEPMADGRRPIRNNPMEQSTGECF
ncbi:hypothetical protein B0537_14315 [Desulforamulus ferrireducens]|uniref:Uncharacterized protein n=1 Tax=Desulforamulus ferrireducens TaxID=1833852 RepID=A0A1S6IZF0_9FIRM|nr:hypothetical protein B0537_14315 [Desulforamulus ferrireducens]